MESKALREMLGLLPHIQQMAAEAERAQGKWDPFYPSSPPTVFSFSFPITFKIILAFFFAVKTSCTPQLWPLHVGLAIIDLHVFEVALNKK